MYAVTFNMQRNVNMLMKRVDRDIVDNFNAVCYIFVCQFSFPITDHSAMYTVKSNY